MLGTFSEKRIFDFYDEYEDLRQDLRKKLMQHCAVVASKRYGRKMLHRDNLEEMAAAIQVLFPKAFKDLAILVSLQPRRKGMLFHACAYLKSQLFPSLRKKKKTESLPTNEEVGEENPQDLVDELKYSMASDVTKIKFALQNSFQHRRELLKKSKNFPHELLFQFFWMKPKIFINFEFELLFKTTDTNALNIFWPKLCSVLQMILFLQKKKPHEEVAPQDVQNLFNFLKVVGHLPAKTKRGAENVNFITACSRVVKFYESHVLEEDILKDSEHNQQPFIVCKYTESKETILQYCIAYDPSVFPLPTSFDFVDALDALYKVHNIFYLDYAPCLQRFFMFLDEFVYKVKQHGVTLNTQINQQIDNELLKLREGNRSGEDDEPFIEIVVETIEADEAISLNQIMEEILDVDEDTPQPPPAKRRSVE